MDQPNKTSHEIVRIEARRIQTTGSALPQYEMQENEMLLSATLSDSASTLELILEVTVPAYEYAPLGY